MHTRLWGIGIVLIVCAAAIGCVTTYPYHENVSMGTQAPPAEPPVQDGAWDQPFYDDLSPYGRWINVSGPGWVWSPNNVQDDWRPYEMGHWVYTDYGWTWSSDEPYGWAVYHYGRWNQDPSYGWVWVPGTEWGPAWVAWHEGGGYVGWAPLPYQVSVQAGIGLNWGSLNISIGSAAWSFTSTRYLADPMLRTRIVPAAQNVTLVRITQNVTNYTYIDNRIVNHGVQVEKVGRACGHNIPRYRVSEADESDQTRGGRVRGNDFVVFRHDPPRGRNSQGRVDPPGHDPDHHGPRDFRPGGPLPGHDAPLPPRGQPAQNQPPQTQPPQTTPPANQQGTTQQTPDNQGRQNQDRGRDSHEGRGHGFFDTLRGKEQPHPGPRGGAPNEPPPGQPAPSGAPQGQPSNPQTQPPDSPPRVAPPGQSAGHPDHPAPGQGQGQRVAPPGQNANDKAKAAKEAAARGKKPKQDKPKEDGSKGDDKKQN
jgi:uncharacterized protein DUF6600